MGNSTSCPLEHMPEDPEPLISDDNLNFKTHDVGWIIAGFFGLIGSVASFWLIIKHLEFYTKPTQQKYIARILFMVPCYAAYSWLSYYWWKHAIYFQLMRDCYEAVVIASFFSLLLYYLGDNEQEHALVFKNVKFKKWIWPLGRWRYKPSGPRFLSIMQWSIGQYWIFRPGCTLVAVISQAFNRYCLESWEPQFTHVYTTTLISISVTVAMYAVLQFYVTMKVELASFQPMLKFFAVKAVVFLCFWQELFLSCLCMAGVIKPTKYWSSVEIQVGISAILSCFEMMIFGFLHIKCFTYRTYRGSSLDPEERKFIKTPKMIGLKDVLDFRDVGRDLWKGTCQIARLCLGKKVEHSFSDDSPNHLENAFGRSRLLQKQGDGLADGPKNATSVLIRGKTDVEKEVERVKLKTEDSYKRGSTDSPLTSPRRTVPGYNSPWANTTTAFTPMLNYTGRQSPSVLSASGMAPVDSVQSALSFPDDAARPHSQSARGLPRSSTGLLYPFPPPETNDSDSHTEYRPPIFPEKLEGDAEAVVYDKPTSWFKRLLGKNSGSSDGRGAHAPLSAPSHNSTNDPGVEEILEDRSTSYDYVSATLEQLQENRGGALQAGQAVHSQPHYDNAPTRPAHEHIHRGWPGPGQPRHGIRMPGPLSPSRYPGFDEQACVDNMYALHAVAEQVISTPPHAPRTWPQPPTRPVEVGHVYPSQQQPRISAVFSQPPVVTAPVLSEMPTSPIQLPRHNLPASRRMEPPNSGRFTDHSRSQRSPQQGVAQHDSIQSGSGRRHGPVQRLGLGLSSSPTELQEQNVRDERKFLYDDY